MRILACTDMHVPKGLFDNLMKLKKKHKPDVLVCCGDISIFSRVQKEVLDILKRIGLPTFLVHGNHDDYKAFDAYCKKTPNFYNVHKNVVAFGEYTFFGWGGEGFSFKQPAFEKWATGAIKHIKDKKGILLLHQPPYGTTMDVVWGLTHVGSKSFRAFIEKHSPKISLALCGHIHEGFKHGCKIKKTTVLNPGNTGVVIDIS